MKQTHPDRARPSEVCCPDRVGGAEQRRGDPPSWLGLIRLVLTAGLAVAIVANAAIAAAQQPVPERFEFGVFGDLGYAPPVEPHYERVLADLSASPLSFVVHLGDLGNPAFGSCTDELQARRLAQFRSLAHPLIFTPGDNDWTDCWQDRAGYMDPFERLTHLRETFFPDEFSLGQKRMALTRQSSNPAYSTFRENARWTQGGVTFVTIHFVDEDLGRTPQGDAEFAERNAANLAWLREAFQEARRGRGLVIMQQADPYFERPPANNPGYRDLIAALETETLALGKPVLFFHGDTHYFRVDMPLMRSEPACRTETDSTRSPTCQIVSFTRVEGFGQPTHHWIQVTVDPRDPNVFTVRPRIVPGNLSD